MVSTSVAKPVGIWIQVSTEDQAKGKALNTARFSSNVTDIADALGQLNSQQDKRIVEDISAESIH